jgi:hypothetical protein
MITITLEAIIAHENILQAQVMRGNPALERALERLTRIKYENMAFIGFQVWTMAMALDAVRLFA